MQIGILHLTDLHFTKKTDLGQKTTSLGNALVNDFFDIKKLYIILSGDIAFSGQKEEYSKAKIFLDAIMKIFSYKLSDIEIKYIMVPGNHDCDFSLSNDVRDTLLKNVNYENIGNDNSFIDLSIKVQNNFWGFYGFYNRIPNDKIFYSIDDVIENVKISFFCINTAWMSKRHEEPASLFFPTKRYNGLLSKDDNKSKLSIAIWHHPINWFNPNTKENNKKEFQHFIETLSPIHFFGHEHEREHYLSINKAKDVDAHLFAGKIFNEDKKPKDSGFQLVKINLNSLEAKVKAYSWNEAYYTLINESTFSVNREQRKFFILKKEFIKELNDIKIPLLFGKKEVALEDVFVYPDIEASTSSNLDNLESYIDSSRIIESEFANCILDGDSQIGKSSLLSIFYLKLYQEGYSPLLIKGEDIKDLDLSKIIKRSFQRQYNNGHSEYDRYMQSNPKKRILLIDDYNKTSLNSHSTKSLLEEASIKFGKVIATIDSTYSLLPSMQADFQNWKFYTIKPLGYKKRNDLIEAFHYQKENPLTLDEEIFIQETQMSFDNVQGILGNKLMPSYPIFILSILQALEYRPMQHQETSFGYCYQTLIHYSLNNAGVTNEYIDTFFNFLTELAYHFIIKEDEIISRQDFDNFYEKYKSRFHIPSYDTVYKMLIKSKIITEKDGYLTFGYKYILYYLSAKKISDILTDPEGKQMVKFLFENMHLEKNANILVFVTHHSKDISFIEESMMNSMIVLDKIEPISLFKDDPFYSIIEGIAEEVKHDVLEINRNPRDERRKLLNLKDESQREIEAVEKDMTEGEKGINEQVKSIFIPFQQSIRSIEIIGQIIRNRKGSLTRTQLHEMTKEIYTTGFRTVGFVSELLNNDKNDIIATIVDESEENESRTELTKRINLFIQMLCLQVCLGIFNKLMFSVGNKDLRELYKAVADDINNPAAKLVSFGINSYYGSISIEELTKISNDLKGNLVATNLLKSRVKSYVYNRNLDYKSKQQIASILNMSIGANNNPNLKNQQPTRKYDN